MTNNAEREGFERWFDMHGEDSRFVDISWKSWQARAQASGVPDGLTLPVSIRGKIYEVPVPVQVRLVLLEMKMKELTTPPKSASVPNSSRSTRHE